VDLTSRDGIHRMTAQTILSEIGSDWGAFPTEHHFASWLGLTPHKAFRGGKVVRAARKKVKNRVATALRTAATTLLHSQTYLGGRYRYLRKHWTEPAKAVKARAHYLAMVYRLLTKGQAWVDRGAAKFEERRKRWEMAQLTYQAREHGFRLTPIDVTH
jgi:transposase